MTQKAYLVFPHDDEIIIYREEIMNQIQNIFLTSKPRNETSHLRTTSPHPHRGIHNEDEGNDQKKCLRVSFHSILI